MILDFAKIYTYTHIYTYLCIYSKTHFQSSQLKIDSISSKLVVSIKQVQRKNLKIPKKKKEEKEKQHQVVVHAKKAQNRHKYISNCYKSKQNKPFTLKKGLIFLKTQQYIHQKCLKHKKFANKQIKKCYQADKQTLTQHYLCLT